MSKCYLCNVDLVEQTRNGVVSILCPRCGWCKEARAEKKKAKKGQ